MVVLHYEFDRAETKAQEDASRTASFSVLLLLPLCRGAVARV